MFLRYVEVSVVYRKWSWLVAELNLPDAKVLLKQFCNGLINSVCEGVNWNASDNFCPVNTEENVSQ